MTLNEFIGPDAGSSSPHHVCVVTLDITASHTGVSAVRQTLTLTLLQALVVALGLMRLRTPMVSTSSHSRAHTISRTNRFASFRYAQSRILPQLTLATY